jgi:hypothetical protein
MSSREMGASPTPPASEPVEELSKRKRKKLEWKEVKKIKKDEHRGFMHRLMLDSAMRLRSLLQGSSTAVPDSLLYAALPRSSEHELFSEIGEEALTNSVLFNGPANSWRGASESEPHASAQARSCRVVDRFLWRPHKYNEKYASQELSLLYQLHRLGGASACDVPLPALKPCG